jgi:hypothetical protein
VHVGVWARFLAACRACGGRWVMTEQPRLPARFVPLRRASRAKRILLFILGPVMWLAAVVVLAFLLHRGDAVEYALVVLVVSFAVGLTLLGWTRMVRVSEEREA